jgi:hypothetical protein
MNVDGVNHGIDHIDELWQDYDDNREAALAIQEPRQQEAITFLEPIQIAARSLEANG